jgi:hypothetical protein
LLDNPFPEGGGGIGRPGRPDRDLDQNHRPGVDPELVLEELRAGPALTATNTLEGQSGRWPWAP